MAVIDRRQHRRLQPGQIDVGGPRRIETIFGGTGGTPRGDAGNDVVRARPGPIIRAVAAITAIRLDAAAGPPTIDLAGPLAASPSMNLRRRRTIAAHDACRGGSASIGFAGGNETFWDDGATLGRHDSISTFSQAGGDRVSLNSATDTPAGVAGTAITDGAGNTTVTLHDGSTITFIGISAINNTFFTTH